MKLCLELTASFIIVQFQNFTMAINWFSVTMSSSETETWPTYRGVNGYPETGGTHWNPIIQAVKLGMGFRGNMTLMSNSLQVTATRDRIIITWIFWRLSSGDFVPIYCLAIKFLEPTRG